MRYITTSLVNSLSSCLSLHAIPYRMSPTNIWDFELLYVIHQIFYRPNVQPTQCW